MVNMRPRLRKLALTGHVVFSVGWLGSVSAFFALAVAGLILHDSQMVRATYLSMELITRFVIVPFCFASFITGLVSSLGTDWGVFRHYWVVVKFAITVVSTFGLLMHARPISYLADVVMTEPLSSSQYPIQIELVIVSGAAILALLVAIGLSVYKPKGVTRYGWRKQNEKRLISSS